MSIFSLASFRMNKDIDNLKMFNNFECNDLHLFNKVRLRGSNLSAVIKKNELNTIIGEFVWINIF